MRLGDKTVQWTSLLLATAFVLLLLPSHGPVWAAEKDRLDDQLEFGIKMAKRGLWSEALFRFSKVLESRPGDVRILNNMAVAYEAIGEFDLALEYYKRALEGDSGNRDLRRNYAQFVEFYESLRPEDPNAAEAGADADADEGAEPNAEEGAGEFER
jgi:Tfp pilus assembly protein PilF